MELKAIDVSSNQGKPDWAKIANSGIRVAILRIHQKYGTDQSFEYNYKGCKSNGILVGGYKFSYALTAAQAVDEAEDVIAALNGRGLDFPVFYDLEYSGQRKLGKQAVEKIALAFLNRVKKAGYKVGIYCNLDWYQNTLTDTLKKYDCWIARYPSNDNGTKQDRIKPTVGIGWQYSEKGSVSGINGHSVDMDVFYKDYRVATEQKGTAKMTTTEAINKLISVAKAEIGYLEKKSNSQLDSKTANAGSANYTKYWRDIKPSYQGQPWCAAFVSWCFMKAFGMDNAKKLLKHWPYVYCPTLGTLFTKNSNPKKGDIVIFYHNGKFTHTGIVIAVNGDKFTTIEGNTSGASGIIANGGGVCQKSYSNSQLPGTKFCSPDYSIVATTATKAYIEYGDSGDDVKALQTKLNKVGYKLEVDGECGNATVAAIKDFQTKYKLTVDGQAGKNTIAKLDAVITANENKNFKAFTGACLNNGATVYKSATGTASLAEYPKLNRGNLVDVLAVAGNRYKIRIAAKYIGYIEKTRITTPDKLIQYPYVGECTANGVAVRKDAGASNAQISGYPTLNKGNLVDVLCAKKDSAKNIWYRVRIANKYTGYVSAKYLKKK